MFKIKIADVVVEIHNMYDYSYKMCRDYLTNDATDFSVTVNESHLEYEKQCTMDMKIEKTVSDGYYEFIAIYRLICERIAGYDAFMFHAAVIEKDGYGYAFSAPSGTGKSTHIALWRKRFKDSIKIVNGDKPIIRYKDGCFYVYGTPWCGKEGWQNNVKCPLKAVCFISRAKENSIRISPVSEAYPAFIRQLFLPEDEHMCQRVIDLSEIMISEIKFYRLFCNMNEDAAEIAEKGMKEGFEK